MSERVIIEIYCDCPNCWAMQRSTGNMCMEAKRVLWNEMEAKGWSRQQGKVFCPKHSDYLTKLAAGSKIAPEALAELERMQNSATAT